MKLKFLTSNMHKYNEISAFLGQLEIYDEYGPGNPLSELIYNPVSSRKNLSPICLDNFTALSLEISSVDSP